MIQPNYLAVGDTVGVIATAKKLEQNQLDGAIELIESWGLEVQLGETIHQADRQFAGTDRERAQDLQRALDNPVIKAVLFARGGYGTARIIDQIDWTKFRESPKWLCGFSDLTVLHAHVNRNLKVETLHSSMPIFFADGNTNGGSESLKQALFGELNQITMEAHSLNRIGHAEAEVIGGNLAVLHSIAGSTSEPDYAGKILFLEDLTEYLYHLDRTMLFLKRSGVLKSLAGLVVGQFTDMMDNPVPYGKSVEEIIWDSVEEYDFPVAFNAPIGHVDENHSVFCGRTIEFEVGSETSILKY